MLINKNGFPSLKMMFLLAAKHTNKRPAEKDLLPTFGGVDKTNLEVHHRNGELNLSFLSSKIKIPTKIHSTGSHRYESMNWQFGHQFGTKNPMKTTAPAFRALAAWTFVEAFAVEPVVIPQFAMKKQFSWINSLQMGLGFHSYVQWPEGISTTTKDLIRWNWNPQQCSLKLNVAAGLPRSRSIHPSSWSMACEDTHQNDPAATEVDPLPANFVNRYNEKWLFMMSDSDPQKYVSLRFYDVFASATAAMINSLLHLFP